ncbi:alpha/beta fold hydrolase [Chitinophaga japonensis]|uniref:Alpha/beta hydrolase family protein n=1 Tax=Chitinophaga japonensis TaxID=104662 RepID=A0A562T552_CHIJA|nr:alpha/beta hydrolase [Chitinophaga japonensis]TWI88632.1 alpha/beta hydrolase family protein [Chitinophaga japonensis]
MTRHLYLISGMGADERMFQHLRFPGEYQVHVLHWLPPRPDEPFTDYAARMAAGMATNGPVTLLGLSFGGMISLEIARQRPIEKNIIISSIKHTGERPPYFNWARKLGLYHLPDQLLFRRRHAIVKHFMNVETPEEDALLRDYLQKKDFTYLRWAVNTVLHWENEFIPPSLVHIHGGADLTFPLKFVKPTYTIPDGGHFMVMNRAAQINGILARELEDL